MLSASMLAWLRSFEAAARHASFTRAASELCVTQGAVSQQVKRLEESLHRQLFIRGTRSLTLTPDGQRLQTVLGQAFREVDAVLTQLRRRTEVKNVVLSC